MTEVVGGNCSSGWRATHTAARAAHTIRAVARAAHTTRAAALVEHTAVQRARGPRKVRVPQEICAAQAMHGGGSGSHWIS